MKTEWNGEYNSIINMDAMELNIKIYFMNFTIEKTEWWRFGFHSIPLHSILAYQTFHKHRWYTWTVFVACLIGRNRMELPFHFLSLVRIKMTGITILREWPLHLIDRGIFI